MLSLPPSNSLKVLKAHPFQSIHSLLKKNFSCVKNEPNKSVETCLFKCLSEKGQLLAAVAVIVISSCLDLTVRG